MANALCTSADITAFLPSGHGLSSAQLTECANVGSREAEKYLSHLYWPFPSHTAAEGQVTPVCPWPVRNAARYFAVWHANLLISTAQGVDDTSPAWQWHEAGEQLLAPLRDGVQQLPNETVTETLDTTRWGDGDPLGTNEAALYATEMTIIPESCEISGYRYGEDFYIKYSRANRAWLFVRLDSNIGSADGESADTLTYECSFLKKHEVVRSGLRTVRLVSS